MKAALNWLEDRTGLGAFSKAALYEHIPGGARWRYVWGSTLVFAFVVQVFTGIFLWMAYSPSSNTAWESVYYIQHHMQLGWLLRGVHHFMAQAMVVLLVLHLFQVVIQGAYRAPREINFWLGLILMQIVLGLSLTGYLLPWDQKGLWATKVATNLMGLVPFVGEDLQRLVVGGKQYGHHTLTRFFALHAGVLPGLLVFFLVLHVALFRKHGITTPEKSKKPAAYFWPDQILRDALACLAVLAVVGVLTLHFDVAGYFSGETAGAQLGAELGAPADPSEQYAAARPEWYFLFLFQLLKYFKSEFVGAILVPSLVMLVLFLMPFIGRWKLGHRFNIAFLSMLVLGSVFLTWKAIEADRYHLVHEFDEDRYNKEEQPDEYAAYSGPFESSQAFQQAREDAEHESQRILDLIEFNGGIPPEGARTLMVSDPVIMGPKLFTQNCASCHSYTDENGHGIAPENPTASNLYEFASRDWIAGLLDPDKINTPEYFGNTRHAEGQMVEVVVDGFSDLGEEGELLRDALVVALSHEAQLPYQATADSEAESDGTLEEGRLAFEEYFGSYACADCHAMGDLGFAGDGPDLTGYGSRQWLTDFISNPHEDHFYGEPGADDIAMPAFAASPHPDDNAMTAEEIDLLVRWLRREDPIAPDGVAKKREHAEEQAGDEAQAADEGEPAEVAEEE